MSGSLPILPYEVLCQILEYHGIRSIHDYLVLRSISRSFRLVLERSPEDLCGYLRIQFFARWARGKGLRFDSFFPDRIACRESRFTINNRTYTYSKFVSGYRYYGLQYMRIFSTKLNFRKIVRISKILFVLQSYSLIVYLIDHINYGQFFVFIFSFPFFHSVLIEKFSPFCIPSIHCCSLLIFTGQILLISDLFIQRIGSYFIPRNQDHNRMVSTEKSFFIFLLFLLNCFLWFNGLRIFGLTNGWRFVFVSISVFIFIGWSWYVLVLVTIYAFCVGFIFDGLQPNFYITGFVVVFTILILILGFTVSLSLSKGVLTTRNPRSLVTFPDKLGDKIKSFLPFSLFLFTFQFLVLRFFCSINLPIWLCFSPITIWVFLWDFRLILQFLYFLKALSKNLKRLQRTQNFHQKMYKDRFLLREFFPIARPT